MTLVEVMAVLFIIGLTAGLVTLTLPQRPTDEQASAQAFARILRDAQEQSILAGQPVGLKLDDASYSLVQWRREGWQPTGQIARLPSRLRIELEEPPPNRPEIWPDMVFAPTGIVEPTSFQLRGRGARIDVHLDETGEVRLVER